MKILAIDPGSEQSAWLFFEYDQPGAFGIYPNDELLNCLRKPAEGFATFKEGLDLVVIETIEPRYGVQMGWETLDTARWIGRFQEAAEPLPVVLLKRSAILRHLGVVTSPRKGEKRVGADSGIRQALTDRFGGKDAAIGLKASPGPLYGISKDMWSALAIAVTHADQEGAPA